MKIEDKIKLFNDYREYLETHHCVSSHGFDVLEHSSKRVLCSMYSKILSEGGELSENGNKLLNEANKILRNEVQS